MNAVLFQEQPFLGSAPKGRAMSERRAEVGLPGVEMGIEMDQGDRPEALAGRLEQRIGDGVVTADGQQVRRSGEQLVGTRLDLVDSLFDVERIACDVARVGDLLGAKRRHFQARMPRAQEPGTLPYRGRPESGARAVRRPAVKRNTDHGHVATSDLVAPRQQRKGRRPREAGRPAGVHGAALGPGRLALGTRRPHLPAATTRSRRPWAGSKTAC